MDDDGIFSFSMVDKFKNNELFQIHAKSYSEGIAKVYSKFLKESKS